MATYTWSIPTGKEITGTTYIKDTDNNISDTINDLVEFVNGEGAHAGQGLTFDLVDKPSVQTITGIKTFSSELVASGGVTGDVTGGLTGNSDTSTALQTSRNFSAEGDIVVSATPFNGTADVVLTASFRSGMIMMWSGTVALIPSGWLLCDGTNGTPDLRGRAVMGAIDDGVDDFSVGGNGIGTIPSHAHNADHNHTASSNTTGSHTHPRKNGIHANNDFYDASTAYGNNGTYTASTSGRAAGDHSHTITVNTKTMDTGTSGTGTDVIPKYYALCYIMKG